MSKEAYEVIIGTAYEQGQELLAIAEAATKLYGVYPGDLAPNLIDVCTYGGDGEQQIGVGIEVWFDPDDHGDLITRQAHINRFTEGMNEVAEVWTEIAVEAL